MRLVARPELHAQTALRGIAALVVFVAHANFVYCFPFHPFLARIYTIFYWHESAVDLFFELSGFILCYVYLSSGFNWKRYAVARFSRIYPVYLASLLVSLAINLSGHPAMDIHGWRLLAVNLLLIQDWLLLRLQSIDLPTWSISVEVFLYIFIFPVLLYGQKYLAAWQRVFLAVLPVALLAGIYALAPKNAIEGALPLLRGILCFISGFFICTLGRNFKFPGMPARVEAVLLLVAASSLFFAFPVSRGTVVVVFPLLAYLSASEDSILSRLIARPALCWLGDISYSIYVWHWPVLTMLGENPGPGTKFAKAWDFHSSFEAALYVLVCLALVLGISHISHFYFERPVSNWLRRRK